MHRNLATAVVAFAGVVGAFGASGARALAEQPLAAGAALVATSSLEPQDLAAYPWVGREGEIEQFLRTAPVERFTDIPVGITKPRRAHFAPGGLAGSMAWKPLTRGMLHGKMESYTSEIAAYRLSRALGLDMVPPSVERELAGRKGAGVYWIEGVTPWDPAHPPKAPGARWSRQMSRMLLFDQLIGNIDRNRGNLLLDADGHVFLIDHSRAFVTQTSLSGLKGPHQFDRVLWDRIEALSRADLDTILRPWLSGAQVDALVARRTTIRKAIDDRVRERGAQVTFLPDLPVEVATLSRTP
ncbi:MAG: hypothetical protein H0V80_12430 [Acidobacteria bacterium]|nr:hypothetical protein [Acidobacteriota bacterium]